MSFGFAFATAFLVAAFTVFAVLGRLLDTVSAGIGSTVAPAMVSGFRAWTPPVGGGLPDGGRPPRRTTGRADGTPGPAPMPGAGPIRVSWYP